MGYDEDALKRRLVSGMNEKVTGDRRVTLSLTADEAAEFDKLIKVLVALRRIAPVLSWTVRMIIVLGAAVAVAIKWNLLSGVPGK